MLNKFLFFMCISSVLTMLNNSLWESDAMRYIVYVVLLVFVGWIFQISYRYHSYFFQGLTSCFLLLVTVNMLVSPYNPIYIRIVKYIGYISCFTFGYIFYENRWSMKCNKGLLLLTLLLPLILVSFFDQTPHKTVFFPMSNTYSYLGLTSALFYYVKSNEQEDAFKKALVLISLYILSCSTLGIVSAIAIAIIIINRRNLRLIIISLFLLIFVILFVVYSNVTIFARIRDVLTVLNAMTWYDWTHLQDMDFYTFTQGMESESDRTDNASFLWRFAHWQNILDGYGEHWMRAIPIGLGDNYSVFETHYACHNEFLKIFAENGIIVFSIVVYWIVKVHKTLRDHKVYYFILAVFIYHFTENLIDTFVANSLFYFSIGYVYSKYCHG